MIHLTRSPRRPRAVAGLVAAAVAAVAAPAWADRRPFTQTYDTQTQTEAETELELYSAQARATFDDGSPQALAMALAVEHGLTANWDVALWHVLEQATGATPEDSEGLHLAEVRLRTRYRIAERGEWPVDVAVHAEGAKAFGVGEWEAAGRLVLARDFGRLTAAANAVGGARLGPDVVGTEVELGWAAGLSFEAVSELRIGVESWGGFDVDEPSALASTVGPAVAWAPTSRFWAAATAGFGVTDEAADLVVSAVLGLSLM